MPTWVDIVKTAAHKELPPLDADWYFIRAGRSMELLCCIAAGRISRTS